MSSTANTCNSGTVNTVLAGTLEAAFCGVDPVKSGKALRSGGEAATEDIAPGVLRHWRGDMPA
ncbi:hypothetical protein [Streptomyces flaveolus]|uniref:hypothetical protein n=1 Tax=Streptomyces flaveolus TaxID=67297 RepID=UPI003D9E697C